MLNLAFAQFSLELCFQALFVLQSLFDSLFLGLTLVFFFYQLLLVGREFVLKLFLGLDEAGFERLVESFFHRQLLFTRCSFGFDFG